MVISTDSFYGALFYTDTKEKKRIIKVVPLQYKKTKVLAANINTYVYMGELTNDILQNPNFYTFNMRDGLTYVGPGIDENTGQRLALKKIMLNYLEKLENVKLVYKNSYVRPIIDEDFYDPMILYDLDRYERDGKISPLLEAMYKDNRNFTSMDVFVSFLRQRYDDLSYQMAYLLKFERVVKKLIRKHKFSLAMELMNAEFEKRAI